MTQGGSDGNNGDELSRQLRLHLSRIQDPHTASRIYQDFLTDDERARIGSLEEAYMGQSHRTVGMWMRAKNVSFNRAIADVSRCLGMPEAEYESLLRRLGEQRVANLSPRSIPVWDQDRYTLALDGEVIKQIHRPNQAWKQLRILKVFEEEGWTSRIDDPLPRTGRESDLRQLGEAVRSLNRRLQRIAFRRDGSGEGIRWEFTG